MSGSDAAGPDADPALSPERVFRIAFECEQLIRRFALHNYAGDHAALAGMFTPDGTFLGDPSGDPELAAFGTLPLTLRWTDDGTLATPQRNEVAAISRGTIQPRKIA